MRFGTLPLQVALLALASSTFACGSKRTIKDPEPAIGPVEDPIDEEPTVVDNDQHNAVVIGQVRLPEDQTNPIDPAAAVQFTLTFLDVSDTGTVAFNNGVGEMTVRGLLSGSSGLLSFKLLQGNVVKLEGSKADIVLKPGNNRLELSAGGATPPGGTPPGGTPPGGTPPGGSTTGELSIEISIGPPGGGTTPTAPTYAEVASLANSFCVDCHRSNNKTVPSSETYWSGKKSVLLTRLKSKNMPQAPSNEASTMTPAQRETMIKYLESI